MVTPIGKCTPENTYDGNLDKNEDDDDDDDEISLSSDEELNKSSNDVERKHHLQSFWFRAQKHLAGRVMRNDHSVKSIIGNSAYKSLKALYALMKLYIKPEADVKRLYKCLLKTIGKIGVIKQYRNLTDEDYTNIREIHDKSLTIALTLISFAQTDYTYNYKFLKEQLDSCKDSVCQAVTPHLSQKSIERIKHLFNVLGSKEFLDAVYDQSAEEARKVLLRNLVDSLNLLIGRRK
ncbi:Tumor necrosis factor, alpha-induced protein 8-like protein 2 A [Schistosoma japonicum]|nr:Tumor necrosis factor, alpha-induced protein 8-like protein 2 A [Schistosoma japonicum]KAH8849507.1 Tumor necrosis factor, alpha-induced protein 8-like protein 2 A [Schistosoma japonicum]KAH8849508.1 Tumor necrosis factor, alpha-induced protein 8-like protein 2 A [Schistosoma japonicum]KAH8849509.1 Tumor necrosis factor, alpha-induced protein 8-like protein 2 A [Schistosoma japonicum]KAH8849510.1 Tumor necrosis factor, alpha-induced protein 8-like protein 2 A [Schistosoma japonicum]